MPIPVTLIAIIVLFYVLGKGADLIVFGIRDVSKKIGVRVFVLGIVLGFFTSVPELSIAAHAIVTNLPQLSVGNLIGGIFVLFGFILGGSIAVERTVVTSRILQAFIPIALFLFLPFLLAFDGVLNALDGWIMIIGYVLLVTFLYLRFEREGERVPTTLRDGIARDIFWIIAGIILVGAASYALVNLTTALLIQFSVPTFLLGLIVFSLGTNLPEIFVTLRSWSKHIRELSLSNLLGSALANIFIIGLTAASRPVPFTIDIYFFLLAALMATLLLALVFFAYTRERFTRAEGIALLCLYALFLILHSGFLVAACAGVVRCN
ncbi:sodium:calcium antiporter [Candidatus Uhrbacteria bacterium]|nr:sodium:calcium antiporter [Candidatus Uhrbacteria bacterium]